MKHQRLLIIFYKNPIPGQVKTRLAATVGDRTALQIYRKLCEHTRKVTEYLPVDKVVYYSSEIDCDDLWDNRIYLKRTQSKGSLGAKMYQAFQQGFHEGYREICLIGTDIYSIREDTIATAFNELSACDAVLGPAKDGGYYLVGMTKLIDIFQLKAWSHPDVLQQTIGQLHALDCPYRLLETLRDVDTVEDLKKTDLLNNSGLS